MTIKEFFFSKKYNSLYSRLQRFWYNIPLTKHWMMYHNPYNEWWKVRKYFKRPKSHFYKGTYDKLCFFGFPCREDYLNRILDIRFENLGWKSKYDSPRHEYDPYISIVLFRKYMLLWVFNWIDEKDEYSSTRNMATWEAILDMIYFDKSLEWVTDNHQWISHYKEPSEYSITIKENLK